MLAAGSPEDHRDPLTGTIDPTNARLALTHDPRPYPGKAARAAKASDLACDQPAPASGEPTVNPLHVETVAVTAGRPERAVDAPLNPPVVFASTYVGAHDTSAATIGYGRYGNPTWQAWSRRSAPWRAAER